MKLRVATKLVATQCVATLSFMLVVFIIIRPSDDLEIKRFYQNAKANNVQCHCFCS